MLTSTDVAAFIGAFKGKMNQIPFAMALALTRTSQDAQLEVRRGLRARFTIRNNWVERGILYKQARKDNLVASVFSRDDYMVLQEKGGAKRPRGSSVAVPMDVRTNKKGIVTKANRPRPLIAKPDVFVATISGVKGVWQRLGARTRKKTGRSLKLLYVFKPVVTVAARFGFADTVRRVAKERFPRQLGLAIREALRTAR